MGNTPEKPAQKDYEEKSFFADIDKVVEQKLPDFSKTLNIAIIGKVSSGKSSILNALLRRTRETLISKVGAQSGVTDKLYFFQLDERVLIIDSPGLDDIKGEKSEITEQFLRSIDIGLLVITGSADASQKKSYDELKKQSKQAIVVLNKIDEWDHLKERAFQAVLDQWKSTLEVEALYPTCAKGFDPDSKPDAPCDVRGIDSLREIIENFLRAEGKELLLARHMGDKVPYAVAIIVGALVAVAGEAFIPGSAVYITATQAGAIAALYYLYTGKIFAKSSALGLLPTFMGQAFGYNLFLWVKSFLPPTGIVDAAAAAIAVVITFAMLTAVNKILAGGYELHERERLATLFGEIRHRTEATIRNASVADWASAEFWKRLIMQIMYS